MQRALEEQLRRVRVQDLLLESVASILNLSARRIAKPDEQDLEQGRIGIEAVRAVVDLLEPEAARPGARGALAGADALCTRVWRRYRGGRVGRRRHTTTAATAASAASAVAVMDTWLVATGTSGAS